jgi:hypothetical protein
MKKAGSARCRPSVNPILTFSACERLAQRRPVFFFA